MTSQRLRIATRQSPLALWQAEYVKQQLEQHHPGLVVELLGFTTRGDRILDTPLAKIGGKGLFVKELEQALLAGEADIAVHSMKDVPMAFPEGLELGVICPRETPFDALVSNRYARFADLPQGAIVGTSSLRRQCQLRRLRPDLVIRDLRGNVGTRLAKLDAGEFDAIVLAAAGLKRLGLADRICEQLAPELCLPAGGQGAVGIEMRCDDPATAALIAPLACAATTRRVIAERALNHRLQGGCQVPIACYAVEEYKAGKGGTLFLRGLVGSIDGSSMLRAEARAPLAEAEALGVAVADQLLAQGADRILGQLAGTLPLSGLCVAVTRPARQNDGLVQLFRANGAEATAIPLLAIDALRDPVKRQAIDKQLSGLGETLIAIFISQNAAEQTMQALVERGISWPAGTRVYAIGHATASSLTRYGIHASSPARMDSEGLLALEAMQNIGGKRILVFRGLGGRETLGQVLRERGAMVEYCELYERLLPEAACQQWQDWLVDAGARPALACINSTDTLKHLQAIDPDATSRDNLTLVVPGERVAQAARTAGFQRVLTATDALDESILHAALSWNPL